MQNYANHPSRDSRLVTGSRNTMHKMLRILSACLFAVALLVCSRSALADEVAVDVNLQAKLLTKVVKFDRNMAARAKGTVKVVIVKKDSDSQSSSFAKRIEFALSGLPDMGGMPHVVSVVSYQSVDQLKKMVDAGDASIFYFAPGFGTEVVEISKGLSGKDVMTVTSVAENVAAGIVVGFGMENGKPKIFIHFGQAKKQLVDLPSALLNICQVFQ